MFATARNLALAAMVVIGVPAVAGDPLPASRPGVDSSVVFPEVSDATRQQGAFVPVRNIVMVTNGMKKTQIYTLLDVPHFHEGLIGVHRWNYIFNFYTGKDDEFRACQYQIHFDQHYRVDGRWWRTQECADLFERLLADVRAPAIVAAVPVPQPERVARSFELLFDFNSAKITADGQRTVAAVAQELLAHRYSRVVVVGFTDTMGVVDYNDALAARRAAVVVAALEHALPGDSPVAGNIFSRGGRDLAVQTGAEVREVKNRRALVELY